MSRFLFLPVMLVFRLTAADVAVGQATDFYRYERLGERAVVAAIENDEGEYWIATYDGAFRLSAEVDTVLASHHPGDGLGGDAILDIVLNATGEVWAAGRNQLMRWNGTSWSRLPLATETDVVTDLEVDESGILWFAGGLGRMAPVVGSYKDGRLTYYSADDGLIRASVSDLLVDQEAGVWAGTEEGTVYIADGAWRELRFRGGPVPGLSMCVFSQQLLVLSPWADIRVVDLTLHAVVDQLPDLPFEDAVLLSCSRGGVIVASRSRVVRLAGDKWLDVPGLGLKPNQDILMIRALDDGGLLLGTTGGLIEYTRRD